MALGSGMDAPRWIDHPFLLMHFAPVLPCQNVFVVHPWFRCNKCLVRKQRFILLHPCTVFMFSQRSIALNLTHGRRSSADRFCPRPVYSVTDINLKFLSIPIQCMAALNLNFWKDHFQNSKFDFWQDNNMRDSTFDFECQLHFW